jgi:hypothetical protein
MRVNDERLKDIANRNLGVVLGYGVDIDLSELVAMARELQAWRESGISMKESPPTSAPKSAAIKPYPRGLKRPESGRRKR